MKRFIWNICIILICFLLQSTLFQYLALADAVPNLVLIVIVSIGYMHGRMTGMIAGIFSGFLIDCHSGSVLGLYMLFYLVIGYLCGIFHQVYDQNDYTIPIFMVGIADILYNFFFYICEFLLRSRLNFWGYLRKVFLPDMVYTVLISIFLYKLLHNVNTYFTHQEEE